MTAQKALEELGSNEVVVSVGVVVIHKRAPKSSRIRVSATLTETG